MGGLPTEENLCFSDLKQSTLFKGHFIPILQKSIFNFLARMRRFSINLFGFCGGDFLTAQSPVYIKIIDRSFLL